MSRPTRTPALLPINRFLMDIEELGDTASPPSLTAGLRVARGWLDQLLDGSGRFSDESIRNLNAWHAWMTSALIDWDVGGAMPAFPAEWVSDDGAAYGPAPGQRGRLNAPQCRGRLGLFARVSR